MTDRKVAHGRNWPEVRTHVYPSRMGVVERQREEERLYREHLPEILEAIQRGDEMVGVARSIAERSGVDERTTYRWVQFTEQNLDRNRKRLAIRGLIPLWGGILAIVVVVIGVALGHLVLTSPGVIAITVAAVVGIGAGVLLLRDLQGRAVGRVLDTEGSV